MSNIEKDDFYKRVNYIAMCIEKRSTGGPKFIERFFARGDAEYIITALMHKTAKNTVLAKAIEEFAGPGYLEWILVAGEFNRLNRDELKKAAREARKKSGRK